MEAEERTEAAGRRRAAGGRARRLWGLLSGPRCRPLWYVAAGGWLLFSGFRVALLLGSVGQLGRVSSADVAKCLLIGLWYDAMPMGYVLLPMTAALLLAPGRLFGRRWFRAAICGWAGAALGLMLTVEVIGAAFYATFGARLNWLALDHLATFRAPALYIAKTYPVWLLALAPTLGTYLFYRAIRRALGPSGAAPAAGRRMRLGLLAVLAALGVLGCRGSFRRPLRFGPSYFCDNKALAQLTLNNVFTLAHAVRTIAYDSLNELELYAFPPPQTAVAVTREMLRQQRDLDLGSGRNPLWRLTDTGRQEQDYNVVLILMEGMAGEPVGALGYPDSQTPFFDRLCRESLFFRRVYAVGNRTSRGIVGLLCGHPDLGGRSIMKRLRSQGNCLTLPGLLRRRGYHTLFIYGGDPDFDNMKRFFKADGMQSFVTADQMGPSELRNYWGYHDEVILRKAHETFLGMGDRKFFAVVVTISNHRPYDVPTGRVALLEPTTETNRMLNGYRYADWALEEFFRMARGAPYYGRTIFVLVSDHGRTYDPSQLFDVVGYRVPLVVHAPGIVPTGAIDTVGSQTDIAPTLLGLLGGTWQHCFMGRNLLDVRPGGGFALVHDDDRLALVRGDRALVLPPGGEPMLYRTDALTMERIGPEQAEPHELETLRRQLLSYYRTGMHLYWTCSYQDPAGAPRLGSRP